MTRPRVVLLRGHGVTPWELRPWELLDDSFDVSVLVTGSNRFDISGLSLPIRRVRALRDFLPRDLPGDRYLGLRRHLAQADIVHALELGVPWSAQPAALKARLGFKLVLTVWETLPLLGAYRYLLGRRYRTRTIPRVDLFLATTERARESLLLEGAPADLVEVCAPGIDTGRFRDVGTREPGLVVSAGRLVWEKGHQDVLRALAVLRRGGDERRLLIVGRGPEEARLRRYADDLGIGDLVEIRSLPYEEMPDVFARAGRVVLASLPTRLWEEQFGMVLVEAMAAGAPVVASRSGAIPEVVGDAAQLFDSGDWLGLARALAAPPVPPDPERVARFSANAAADRLASAYERALASAE